MFRHYQDLGISSLKLYDSAYNSILSVVALRRSVRFGDGGRGVCQQVPPGAVLAATQARPPPDLCALSLW